MKNPLSILIILMSCMTMSGQNIEMNKNSKHELKLNTTNLFIFSYIDTSYEYLINENASVGIGVLYSFSDDALLDDEQRTFSLTPYYRRYFSNTFAKGVYIEGFTMLNSGQESITISDVNGNIIDDGSYTDFAVGISAGTKLVTSYNLVIDFYIGVARNLLSSNFAPDAIGRGGVALGYRF